MGAMMPFMDPSGRAPLVADLRSRPPEMGSEGYAPVVAVLLASAKGSGADPVTNFRRSNRLYREAMRYNRGLDRDNDKIACEKH
jgi:hypothetical protein